jgi:hypothetical protein
MSSDASPDAINASPTHSGIRLLPVHRAGERWLGSIAAEADFKLAHHAAGLMRDAAELIGEMIRAPYRRLHVLLRREGFK